MYKVIKHFCDLQDKNHSYNEGDIFPREGLQVTEERLAELAGSQNKQKAPLIAVVEEVAPAQPLTMDEKETANEVTTAPGKSAKKGTKKPAE